MPDLLAHALLAYAVGRLASLRWRWLTTPYVTAVVAGAFVPDVMKVRLLVNSGEMTGLLGVPFAWEAWRTLGGVALLVAVGALLVDPDERERVTLALALGTVTHLVTDAMLVSASGRSYQVLWPLTRWKPPTPGLFLSTEPGPAVVAAVLAAGAWAFWRHRTDAEQNRTDAER